MELPFSETLPSLGLLKAPTSLLAARVSPPTFRSLESVIFPFLLATAQKPKHAFQDTLGSSLFIWSPNFCHAPSWQPLLLIMVAFSPQLKRHWGFLIFVTLHMAAAGIVFLSNSNSTLLSSSLNPFIKEPEIPESGPDFPGNNNHQNKQKWLVDSTQNVRTIKLAQETQLKF